MFDEYEILIKNKGEDHFLTNQRLLFFKRQVLLNKYGKRKMGLKGCQKLGKQPPVIYLVIKTSNESLNKKDWLTLPYFLLESKMPGTRYTNKELVSFFFGKLVTSALFRKCVKVFS